MFDAAEIQSCADYTVVAETCSVVASLFLLFFFFLKKTLGGSGFDIYYGELDAAASRRTGKRGNSTVVNEQLKFEPDRAGTQHGR